MRVLDLFDIISEKARLACAKKNYVEGEGVWIHASTVLLNSWKKSS